MNVKGVSAVGVILLLVCLAVAPLGGTLFPGELLALTHALAFVAFLAALAQRPAGAPPAVLILAAAFAAWCCVGSLRAGYGFGSFTTTWDVMMALAVLAAAWWLGGSGLHRPMVLILQLSALLQSTLVLAETALGVAGRASGTFLNPNHLAAWLNLCIGLAAGRALARRGRDPLALSVIGLALAAQFVLGSRGALLGLGVAGLLAVVALVRRLDPRRRRRALGLAAVGVVLLGTLGWYGVQRRFAAREDTYRHSRLEIWSASLAAAAEHPIAGIGPGMYEHTARRWNFPQEGGPVRYGKWFRTSHSQYLDVLVETGAVGLGLLLLATAGAFWGVARRRGGAQEDDAVRTGILLALASLAAHAVVEPLLVTPAVALTAAALTGLGLQPGAPVERRLDWRVVLPGAAVAMAIAWIGIVAPWLGDRHFQRMRRAPDAESFRAELTAALRFNPFQPYYYQRAVRTILRGVDHLELASYGICYDYAAKAVALNPTDPHLLMLQAEVSRRGSREVFGDRAGVDEAVRLLELAVQAAPTDPGPAASLAGLLLDLQRDSEALQVALRALAIEPGFLEAARMRQEALRRLGREAEAQQVAAATEAARRRLIGYRPRSDYEAMILGMRGADAGSVP